MFKCLKKFNFGDGFLNWIKILYTDPNVVITNNGYLSREIKLIRLRQGYPISALIFILCVEIMAIKIRNNKNIKGLIFNVEEHKISQYADDSTLVMTNLESIDHSLLIINEFSNYSSLRLNVDKSEIVLLGQLKLLAIETYANIKIQKSHIKCLGIYVGHNKLLCEQLNWENKISNLEKILYTWGKRHLLIFGKVVIVNILGISKLVYNFTLLSVPENVIIKIEKIIKNFLWPSRSRINRNCMINCTEL